MILEYDFKKEKKARLCQPARICHQIQLNDCEILFTETEIEKKRKKASLLIVAIKFS